MIGPQQTACLAKGYLKKRDTNMFKFHNYTLLELTFVFQYNYEAGSFKNESFWRKKLSPLR